MSYCDNPPPAPEGSETLDLPEGVPPLNAFYLYLSDSCNLACRHCWITPRLVNGVPDPGDVIDLEALRSAIEEAKPLGLSSVKLTGGEPMLHPRFLEIVDLMTENELGMVMETNGTLLTSETALYLKNETSMDFISLSIDSADPQKHDSFRGVEGSFKAVLEGLDHLVEAGFDNVQVIMSVHRGNRHEIEDVARLAASHGAGSIKFSPVTNSGRGLKMKERGETLDFDELIALNQYIYNELDTLLKNKGIEIGLLLNTPPALMPIHEIMRRNGDTGDCGVLGILGILGSGEIALCGIGRNIPELSYGQLGKDSIRDIWFTHQTIIKLRQLLEDVDNYPAICRECTMAKQCRTGCVAQNFVNSNRLLYPQALCLEAYQKGVFPATRQKKPLSADKDATL